MAMIAGVSAQGKFYENPRFPTLAKTHDVIAILPFEVTLSLPPRQMKRLTAEQYEEMVRAEGEEVQESMHVWFLKRKKRGNMLVDVQMPQVTRAKLVDAGLTVRQVGAMEPQELCAILDVDAVVMGSYESSMPMSDAAAIATYLVLGFPGVTEVSTLKMNVYEGELGELMCSYRKSVSRGFATPSEALVNKLMRKASRRITYNKLS